MSVLSISEGKYGTHVESALCKKILESEYKQVIYNIIEDDEMFITEEMKIEFFEYLSGHDGSSDFIHYCDNFFDTPIGVPLVEKKYLLKGKTVSTTVHKKELGRVTSKGAFRRNLNSSISRAGLTPISDEDDEALIDSFLVSTSDYKKATENIFENFLSDTGIGEFQIQGHAMWTFEGLYDEDVFKELDLQQLPCVLGLPGPKRTEKDYNNIPRIAFSVRIPSHIEIKKPTSFDAGIMSVWRCGGKTLVHDECKSKFGKTGFEEYIHEPISLNCITSKLIEL